MRSRALVRTFLQIEAALLLLTVSAASPVSAHHTETSPVRIDALDVSVSISHHYAVTTVTETLTNPADTAYEFSATVAAPDRSFVTRFALETGGHTYESRVEESAAARAAYDAGVAASAAAAIVESRDTDNYRVSLNIPARTTVVVHMAYEELIARTHGSYTYRFPLVTTVNGHTVGSLTLGGSVSGSAAITSATSSHGVPALSPSSTAFSASSRSSFEVPGSDFTLSWVEALPPGAGSLLAHTTSEGTTFVHTFSPEGAGLNADPIPKDIVFVLDVSGSMSSSLPQVKAVFSSIIADLSEADRFDVVAFSDSLWKWSDSIEPATQSNRDSARRWVEATYARSGTDIDGGLAYGASLLPADAARAPILLLLSDGEPTVGETRGEVIRTNLLARNVADASVYTLAFGPHADYGLMQALALENGGEVRRIWLDGDAASQIRGFYDTISTPLLRGVTVSYEDDSGGADPSTYPSAFSGSDLVTAGQLAPGASSVTITVSGYGALGPVTLSETFDLASAEAGAFVERAYAYARIEALARPAALGDVSARQTIVGLALEHSFVTPYTSLVVVVPASLQAKPGAVESPMLLTTSGALEGSPPTPANAYSAAPPGRATPGPGALLAGLALVGTALAARRRR